MVNQSERVLQHPIMGALDSLDAPLEQAAVQTANEPNTMSLVARLRAMREHARATLVGADPALVTDQVLNTAHPQVQSIGSHLSNYLNGAGIAHLNSAMSEADSLFGVLARVPAQITGPRAAAVTRALGGYHETVEQYTRIVEEQFGSLQNRTNQLTTTITAAEQRVANTETRVDSIIAQYQSTFEATQAQRQQAFDNAQTQRQQTIDAQNSTHRADFNEIAQQLRTASATLLDSAKSELADAVKALDDAIGQAEEVALTKAKELDAEYRAITERLKKHLESRRDEADKLVGLMGERGVTSTYQKTANEARREMYVWQVLTVVVMGGLLAGAIFEFLPALKSGWNWGIGGARLMVAIIATLLASYTGTQAKIARDTVRKNRRREMDLAALGPYLASLPDAEQHDLRSRIADRYFVEDGGPALAATGVEVLLTDPDIVAAAKGIPKAALLAAIKGLAK